MTEDVIAALSKFKELLVIARNTMFTFKEQTLDVAEVAEQLGVRYVVEGSVRRAEERIRVAVDLVDATQRAPIWSERYDRRLEDIFDVQDDITEKVVGAIAPAIQLAEEQQASAKAPSNLDAWGQYHLGLSERQITGEGVARMVERFTRAVTLDPRFAAAHTWLGLSRYYEGAFGFSDDRAGLLKVAHRHVQDALKLDDADAMARATAARILAAQGQHDGAMREAERAVE